jgi:hypothetical protein
MDETGNTAHSTPAAIRMRAHRQRRKAGLRCILAEIRATEIDVLIRRGLMKADTRHDAKAIRNALYQHLDDTLSA